MKTIKLQGVHEPQAAIPAGELKPGMIRLYNYGVIGEIVSVTPSKTGKSVTLVIKSHGEEYTRRLTATTLVAVGQGNTAPVKASDRIKEEIEAVKAEFDRLCQESVWKHPDHNQENHNAMWTKFWNEQGRALRDKEETLKWELNGALHQELQVGDGVTYHLWSDAYACTVIARTAKTLTIRRDKATRSPNFKPEFVPGGFSAICTNNEDQEWCYEPDPNGEVIVCHWSEKEKRWRAGPRGDFRITLGRHEFYDYNF